MPVWLTILIAVIGALVGVGGLVVGIIGLNAYSAERARHKAAKKNRQEDAAEQAELAKQQKLDEIEQKEFMDELVEAVTAALSERLATQVNELFDRKLKPVNDKLERMEDDIKKVKAGVQDTCRFDLEALADVAEKQGYLPRYDKDRFDHMYNSYHDLGENGVMDATHKKILAMPESKPRRRSPSRH